MLGEPQRGDRGRHAQLRGGRQRSGQRLAHEQRREHVDRDVQHRKRACQREQRRVIDESGEVELGAEHNKVERHEEAVGDAAHLR